MFRNMNDTCNEHWEKYRKKYEKLIEEFGKIPNGLDYLINNASTVKGMRKPLDSHYEKFDSLAISFINSLKKADNILDEYFESEKELLISSFTLPNYKQKDFEWFFGRMNFSKNWLLKNAEEKFGIKYEQKGLLLKTLNPLREAYLNK